MKAKIVIWTLYWDKTIKKGKVVTNDAKVAPAPRRTNIEGKAQHIKVDDEANSERKLADWSFILILDI